MMKKVYKYLYIIIFSMMVFLIGAATLKIYSVYDEKMAEEDLEDIEMAAVIARNTEAHRRVAEMEYEIADMLDDVARLQEFIDEKAASANEVQIRKGTMSISGNVMIPEELTESVDETGTVSGNSVDFASLPVISGSVIMRNGEKYNEMSVSGNSTVSENSIDVSGNESVSGNASVSENASVSGNGSVSGNSSVSGNESVSVNGIEDASGNVNYAGWQYVPPEVSLEERRALMTSYEQTLEVNQSDKEVIEQNEHDFSQMKIACLGDSITAAVNLENEENYEQYSYPSRLKEILGAGEVVNLGIGGSSIGRYWTDAYVDRYMQIPEDTDIIIVLGGTNDGFCVSDKEFGNLDDRIPQTFCGDVNELMRGLKDKYPSAVIFFATPLPNVLHDYLMSEKEYLLQQRFFADVIRTIANEYGIETIDLYNSNILDSHDANVIAEYMPDGVHGNPSGYQILAEHFAAEIVKYYN